LAFDAAAIPQSDPARKVTYGDFYGVAIAGNSRNKPLALSAAGVMASADSLQKLAPLLSLSPARRDLLAAVSADPWQQVFNTSAIFARSWIDPDPVKTRQIFQAMLERVQTGQVGIDAAVAEADGQIKSLYVKYNPANDE
jgi:ABC-type glycerol-3-phosphate transport system substrate-binding protein